MEIQERICGLCLKICDNFEAIEGDMKNFLDVVLPKIDLAAIRDPVMCASCTETLMKCFDFKAACVDTFDYLVPFVDNRNDAKVDLKDVYLIKNDNSTGVSEGEDVCGFCLGLVKDSSVIPLNFEEGDISKKMVERCFPELDLSAIKNPVICEPCHESLRNCFCFVTNCLIVEEKIKKYRETVDVNSGGPIELTSLVQFTLKDLMDEVDGGPVDLIKPEKQFCDDRENADVEVYCKNKSFHHLRPVGDEKFNNNQQFLPKNMMTCTEESKTAIRIKEILPEENNFQLAKENLEMEDRKILVKEEIEIKTDEQDFNRFENDVFPQPAASNLEQDPSKSRTEHTSILTRYLSAHKDTSEIPVYKCNSCSYQAKDKSKLKSHLLVHKDPTQVEMYKCPFCLYQTKHKYNLKRHSLLVHKDPSETATYKCNFCSYQAKYNYRLKSHLLVHKDPQAAVYKCNSCLYETEEQDMLNEHLLLHNKEVRVYKCSSCSYQARRRLDLDSHLLVHKDPSEIAMYKCNTCSFQARQKGDLKRHLLVHRDPSEILMHKCNLCSHQTKYKSSLKKHLLLHETPSVYTCNSCSYQTKQKQHLTKHLLIHK